VLTSHFTLRALTLRCSLGDKINIEGTQLSFTKMVRSEEEPATPKNKTFSKTKEGIKRSKMWQSPDPHGSHF